jgi:hypothetical protein
VIVLEPAFPFMVAADFHGSSYPMNSYISLLYLRLLAPAASCANAGADFVSPDSSIVSQNLPVPPFAACHIQCDLYTCDVCPSAALGSSCSVPIPTQASTS